MSKKLYEENSIQDIANAIRSQNGTHDAYTIAQMGNAIRAIKTQPNLEPLTANQNGTYTPSLGKDGFSSVIVDVDQEDREPVIEPFEVTENTQNGIYNPPSGVDGYAPVTVNVSGGSDEPSNPTTWQTGMVMKTTFNFDNLHIGGGSSMSLTKNNDYSITVSMGGGGQVGAAIYWGQKFNVNDIESISVKFKATAHYSTNFPVKIGIATTIAGDNVAQSFVVYDSSLDITGEEVTLSVNLQSYTGDYFIIVRADGVSCILYDFNINYAQ